MGGGHNKRPGTLPERTAAWEGEMNLSTNRRNTQRARGRREICVGILVGKGAHCRSRRVPRISASKKNCERDGTETEPTKTRGMAFSVKDKCNDGASKKKCKRNWGGDVDRISKTNRDSRESHEGVNFTSTAFHAKAMVRKLGRPTGRKKLTRSLRGPAYTGVQITPASTSMRL